MGLLGKLGSMWVEVTSKGIDVVQKDFAKTKAELAEFGAAAAAAGQTLASAFARASPLIAGLAGGVATAVAAIPGLSAGVAAAKGAVNAYVDEMKGHFGELGAAIKGVPGVMGGLSAAAAALAPVFKGLSAAAGISGAGMTAAVKGVIAVLPNLASAIGVVKAVWQGIGLDKNPFSAREINETAKSLPAMFKGAAQAAGGLADAISPLTSRLYGFVQAGFSASAEGQIFGQQMQEISHQIASLFVPQIRALIEYTGQVVGWFQNLSGEQQAQLRQWGLLAGGIMATAMILPRLIATFGALKLAIAGIRTALLAVGMANPWLLLLAGLAAVVASTMTAEEGMVIAASAGEALKDVFTSIAEPIKDLVTGIRGLVQAMRDFAGAGEDTKGSLSWLMGVGNMIGNTKSMLSPLKDMGEKIGMPKLGSGAQNVGSLLLAPILGPMASLGKALGWIKDEVKPKKGAGEERTQLGRMASGFESHDATWRRISMASMRATAGGKSDREIAEESRDYLKFIKESMDTIKEKDLKAKVGR